MFFRSISHFKPNIMTALKEVSVPNNDFNCFSFTLIAANYVKNKYSIWLVLLAN